MVSRAKVVQPALCISFFACEFVVVDIVAADGNFSAVRIVIGFLLWRHGSQVVGDDIRRAQIVREIVVDRATRCVSAGHALASEENVLLVEYSAYGALG